jgi:hypothetical protein
VATVAFDKCASEVQMRTVLRSAAAVAVLFTSVAATTTTQSTSPSSCPTTLGQLGGKSSAPYALQGSRNPYSIYASSSSTSWSADAPRIYAPYGGRQIAQPYDPQSTLNVYGQYGSRSGSSALRNLMAPELYGCP